jgi:hypothetical protein
LIPIVLVIVAVAFAMSAIARRRCQSRAQAIRAVREAMTPPARYGPVESFPMRRVIWGGLVGIVAIVVLLLGLFTARVATAPMAPPGSAIVVDSSTWIDQPPEAPALVVQAPDVSPPNVRPPEIRMPSRKQRFWLKPEKVAQAEPSHQWKGTIERTAVASLANSKEEKYAAIRDALVQQLHLQVQPPARFFETPAYIKIDEAKGPIKQDPDFGDYFRISYKVELTPLGWDELSKMERADRAGERMEISARGLGFLTVLLGAVAAYVRLDDWTKGYYSGRLFLVAFGLAAVVGVVILRG